MIHHLLTQAAIASISHPCPYAAEPEPIIRIHSNQEPNPYKIPANIKAPRVTLNTEIPDTEAASGFPPTAYKFLPNFVLFQMNANNHRLQSTAHKIIVGKPSNFRNNLSGNRLINTTKRHTFC